MFDPFLLGRLQLQFDREDDDLVGEISAIARTPDGSLWVGSDELQTLERLFPGDRADVFGEHKPYPIPHFVDMPNADKDEEVDIEGIDFAAPYLWVTGSHSTKRKKPKGKKRGKDLERLAEIEAERNRYLLARVPFADGGLRRETPDGARAACLPETNDSGGNPLMDALKFDPHLGLFARAALPSKENGLDIEGLAVRGDRVFLGLRGPVLRGWAVVLELRVREASPGVLGLDPVGEGDRPYKKHFLNLDGLGIRDLCWHGDDLLILTGPTMDLDGPQILYRLEHPEADPDDALVWQDGKHLQKLWELPLMRGCDRAEGMTVMPWLGDLEVLVVAYDNPHPLRRMLPGSLLADAFVLNPDR